MAVYDDDEENPPIGFEQDPESDDIGDGYWTYADVSRKYAAGDAEDAKKLMSVAPPPDSKQTMAQDARDPSQGSGKQTLEMDARDPRGQSGMEPLGEQGPYSPYRPPTPEAA